MKQVKLCAAIGGRRHSCYTAADKRNRMPKTVPPGRNNPPATTMAYIGKSRLHLPRANLIQTVQMVQAFCDLGVDIELILPPWKCSDARRRLESLSVDARLPVRQSWLLKSAWRPLGLKVFGLLHYRKLRARDIVYLRSVDFSNVFGAMGIPHVLEVHEIHDLDRISHGGKDIRHYQRGCLRHFIAISRQIQSALLKRGVHPKNILVAHSGFNAALFSRVGRFDPSSRHRPNMVYVGRISEDRGLKLLMALGEEHLGRMTLVGPLDTERKQYDNLSYEGLVAHRRVPAVYEKADIVLLPYQKTLRHSDSISPIKLFEAMAAGRPIIASDLPSIREVIVHKHNGLLVDPESKTQWVGAIELLKNDRELAAKLAHNARSEAKRYSWENRARVILDALAGRHRRAASSAWC